MPSGRVKRMHPRICLAGAFAGTALLAAAALAGATGSAPAGEGGTAAAVAAATPRQNEILRELATFRPA